MSPLLITTFSIATGTLIGGFVGFNFGTGVGASAAMDRGFSAGACAAMVAARGQGLVTSEDFDPVLTSAAKIPGSEGLESDAQLTGMAEKCEALFEELRMPSRK